MYVPKSTDSSSQLSSSHLSSSPIPFPQSASPPVSATSSPSSSAMAAVSEARAAAAAAAKAAKRSSSRGELASRLATLPSSSETLHASNYDDFQPLRAPPVIRPAPKNSRTMSTPAPIVPIPYPHSHSHPHPHPHSSHSHSQSHQLSSSPASAIPAPLNRRLSVDDDLQRPGTRMRLESTSSVALMSNNTDIQLPQARGMRRTSHSAVRQLLIVRQEGKPAMRFVSPPSPFIYSCLWFSSLCCLLCLFFCFLFPRSVFCFSFFVA